MWFFRRQAVSVTFLFLLFIPSISFADINEDLIKAARKGDVSKVVQLISKGADINAREDIQNRTAFMEAVAMEQIDVVNFLVNIGADINLKDGYGETVLMFAAVNGNTDLMKVFLNKGADINTKNNEGTTALMKAVSYGLIDVVKLLVSKGAKKDVKDKNGETASVMADKRGKKYMANFLDGKGDLFTESIALTRDEYDVYSVVIKKYYMSEGPILVGCSTHAKVQMGDNISDVARWFEEKFGENLDVSLLNDYRKKNVMNYRLENRFSTDLKIYLIPNQEISDSFRGRNGWGSLYSRYPKSGGIVDVSRVGFNKEKTMAVVLVGVQSGGLSGGGDYVLLKKTKEGAWTVVKKTIAWIS